MNLIEALGAMDAYRAAHGSYRGFTATDGRQAVPSLAWADGLGSGSAGESHDVAIIDAHAHLARITTLSDSGSAFCVEHTEAGVSFGQSTAGLYGTRAARSAITACGSTPWTDAALRPPPPLACSPGAQSYVVCRATEALIVKILSSPSSL